MVGALGEWERRIPFLLWRCWTAMSLICLGVAAVGVCLRRGKRFDRYGYAGSGGYASGNHVLEPYALEKILLRLKILFVLLFTLSILILS